MLTVDISLGTKSRRAVQDSYNIGIYTIWIAIALCVLGEPASSELPRGHRGGLLPTSRRRGGAAYGCNDTGRRARRDYGECDKGCDIGNPRFALCVTRRVTLVRCVGIMAGKLAGKWVTVLGSLKRTIRPERADRCVDRAVDPEILFWHVITTGRESSTDLYNL